MSNKSISLPQVVVPWTNQYTAVSNNPTLSPYHPSSVFYTQPIPVYREGDNKKIIFETSSGEQKEFEVDDVMRRLGLVW